MDLGSLYETPPRDVSQRLAPIDTKFNYTTASLPVGLTNYGIDLTKEISIWKDSFEMFLQARVYLKQH